MADVTAPSLSRLAFPTVVDLSNGSKAASFSASATDDASGVDYVVVYFDKKIDQFSSFLIIDNYGQNAWASGAETISYTFNQYLPPGEYKIDHVDVRDLIGNVRTYTPAQLQALGSPTGLVLTGSQGDTAAPRSCGGLRSTTTTAPSSI